MSDSPLGDFITKKEVEQRYGRSHRSLTRDFSAAVRTGDADILAHLKLHTEDDKVRSGTEVSLEMIQDLSNRGLTPTWYVHRTWAENRYGPRSKELPKKTPADEMLPPLPKESSTEQNEVVVILKEQLRRVQEEHQKDKEAFREQIKMFKEMFDTLKDDHADTKSLLKEVHTVFGNVSQNFLGRPQPDSGKQPTPEASSQPVDANVVPTARETTIVEQPAYPQPKQGTRTKKTTPKKTPAATSKKQPAKSTVQQLSWTDKHLPTLKKLFSHK